MEIISETQISSRICEFNSFNNVEFERLLSIQHLALDFRLKKMYEPESSIEDIIIRGEGVVLHCYLYMFIIEDNFFYCYLSCFFIFIIFVFIIFIFISSIIITI